VPHNGYLEARQQYAERRRTFAGLRDDREQRSTRLGVARLLVFAGVIAVIIFGAAGLAPSALAVPLGVTLAVLFVVLVRTHARIRRDGERFALLAHVNAVAGLRATRSWDALPDPPPIAAPHDHPYAEDLAIFGRTSLWQLLPDVSPAPGRTVLAEWLLGPAHPDVVRERQEAVAELTPRIDLRDDLTAFAMQLEGVPAAVVRLTVRLPETITWLDGEAWLIPVARGLTAASLATWAMIAVGLFPVAVGGIAILACGVFWGSRAAKLRSTFARADVLATAMPWYADVIARLSTESMNSPRLHRLGGSLRSKQHDASVALRELRRILQRAEVRYSPLMHIPLQVVGLWDFHVAHSLRRWCRTYGADIASWFESLGEIEALSALAGIRHANPRWCFPSLRSAADRADVRLEAMRLGHPLIAPEVMVANDLTIGPPGTFVLVTGSNMSGKSTLLRSVGLNTVLAQAGAPVCATTFALPALRVQTSIRIQDSLADGVSLFMAELQRLRRVVDAAEEAPPVPEVLYLLDEMLQGTNSAERHLAARTVLARLVRSRAIGLVTTHDVALASAPELAAVAVPVYFDETVHTGDDVPLSFDYRLRPGIVPAGNAMRLLSLVGLGPGFSKS
jgi:Flp pilus assembly protein TadB